MASPLGEYFQNAEVISEKRKSSKRKHRSKMRRKQYAPPRHYRKRDTWGAGKSSFEHYLLYGGSHDAILALRG